MTSVPSTTPSGSCAALTGGIGCGKSTAAAWFAAHGVEVLDADDVSHALTAPGGPAIPAIVDAFGKNALARDGSMDRRKIGVIVFSDPAKRLVLENILHPMVADRFAGWRRDVVSSGRRGLAVIPLLFECGLQRDYHPVICIAADESIVLKRLEKRGLSPSAAAARIAVQWPLRMKTARADHVITNNGTRQQLHAACLKLYNRCFAKGTTHG